MAAFGGRTREQQYGDTIVAAKSPEIGLTCLDRYNNNFERTRDPRVGALSSAHHGPAQGARGFEISGSWVADLWDEPVPCAHQSTATIRS